MTQSEPQPISDKNSVQSKNTSKLKIAASSTLTVNK
jgi:hypothetical protein